MANIGPGSASEKNRRLIVALEPQTARVPPIPDARDPDRRSVIHDVRMLGSGFLHTRLGRAIAVLLPAVVIIIIINMSSQLFFIKHHRNNIPPC